MSAMRLLSGVLAASAAGAALAIACPVAAAEGPLGQIEISGAVARVVVIPEARQDVDVQITQGPSDLPKMTVLRLNDGKVLIQGGVGRQVEFCASDSSRTLNPLRLPDNIRVHVAGRAAEYRLNQAPLIVIHAPRRVSIIAGDAVFGTVGRSEGVSLINKGCGDWTVADVAGPLSIENSDSGDVRAGVAEQVRVAESGSGDVRVVSARALDVTLGGSGDVTAKRIDGPVTAVLSGSGDVRVAAGQVGKVSVKASGSGDLRIAPGVGEIDAVLSGSGDVKTGPVAGRITKVTSGSGSVVVGR